MTLDGLRPDDVYYEKKPEKPKRDAKTVPCNIEHHRFQEKRVTGRLLPKRLIRIGLQGNLKVFPLLVASGCSAKIEVEWIVKGFSIPIDEIFAFPSLHTDTTVCITNCAGVVSVPDSECVGPVS